MNIFELFVSNDAANDLVKNIVHNIYSTLVWMESAIKKFPFDGLIEAYSSYALVNRYYPPCLYFSTEQHLSAIKLLSSENPESVETVILDVYNDQLIGQLCSEWCDVVQNERKTILLEAIDCYYESKYYACNTLLLSQFGGIIKDNNIELSSNEVINYSNRLKELADDYQKGKYVNCEKRIVERLFLINLQGSLCAFAKYFVEYLYASQKIDPLIISSIANRNKVLHGEDLLFGTRIKALKTIICMDMLIKLPNIQKKLGEQHNNG